MPSLLLVDANTCDIQAVVTIPPEMNFFLCLNVSIVREAVTPAATGCDVMACTCLLDVKVLGVKQAVLPAPEGSIDKEPFYIWVQGSP